MQYFRRQLFGTSSFGIAAFGPFGIAPRVYAGSVALGLQCDGQLYEEGCVRYLRGEPITTFLVDRDLAARLDAESSPL